MRRRAPQASSRVRAVALLEVVIVVVVLAIAIPPTLAWMMDASAQRADAVNTTRATVLATTVMEHIVADAYSSSTGRGMSAFASASTYLDTPSTGLKARLAGITAPYTAAGLSYSVTIGTLVNAAGVTTGDAAQDVVRPVTVTVTFPRAAAAPAQLAVSMRLAAP